MNQNVVTSVMNGQNFNEVDYLSCQWISQRQNENVNETTCYILGDSFNLVSTIDFM